jgi:3-hydroxyisobutyrate dehydrogenase-like beta-hydroxyacid dehydrogenase
VNTTPAHPESETSCAPLSSPIGLVGAGLLGTALAARLLAAGWRVCVWDLRSARREALAAMGCAIAPDVGGVFGRCQRVLFSLPDDRVVASVLEAARGQLKSGAMLIDTSTGAPAAARRMAGELAQVGVTYLDATVSGSSQQALRGEALMMVGADESAWHACRDLLEVLARRVVHVGPPGSGAAMKLVTNLVLGLNRAALAEGFALAKAQGLDPAATLHLLRESLAYSRIMDSKGPKMLQRDFEPEARLSQHLKDVRLMLGVAEQAAHRLPLTEVHRSLLEQAESLGFGELDNSAILLVLEAAQTGRDTAGGDTAGGDTAGGDTAGGDTA